MPPGQGGTHPGPLIATKYHREVCLSTSGVCFDAPWPRTAPYARVPNLPTPPFSPPCTWLLKVAAIIEHGGDDPQIPPDVNEGCGTHPTGTQDEAADSSNRADSKSQLLEARGGGGGGGEFEGGSAVVAAAGDPGGIGAADGGAAAARAKAADRGAVRSPSATGSTSNGGGSAIAVRTDGDDFAAAGAGACTRCGARVPCACGGGARGGGSVGGSGTGGGGNTTPGRRFGSPQQSKGLRNVMSWAPGGSASASASKGRGSGVSDDGGGDNGGRRRRRSSCYGEDTAEWNPSSSDGSGGSVSSEGSLNQPSVSHGSQRRERSSTGGEEVGPAEGTREFRFSGGVIGGGGLRKRSRGVGLRKSQDGSGSATDQGADSNGSRDNGATAPARPKSPRSPRSHSSTRLKRVSGGDSSRGSCSIDGDDPEGERTTVVTTLSTSNRGPSQKSEGSKNGDGRGEQGGEVEEEEGGGGHRLVRNQPSRPNENSAPPANPSTGLTEVSRKQAEQRATCSRQNTSAADDRSTASPPPGAAPGAVGTQLVGNAASPRRRSSAAAPAAMPAPTSRAAVVAAAAAGVGGSLVLDHLAVTPRTPRSPRLVSSGSETFKTAKRLSEALTFAASGSEGGLLTSTASLAVGRLGLTPRRESAALGEALAVVLEAAAEANGTPRGEPLGGGQSAEVRNAAAVVGSPPPVGGGGVS